MRWVASLDRDNKILLAVSVLSREATLLIRPLIVKYN
jgi:hypothetical protein